MTTNCGIVKAITSRDWKNNISMWNFMLINDPVTYNCGTTEPKISVGDEITFEVNNRKVDTSTIKPLSGEGVRTPPKAVPAAMVPNSPTDGTVPSTSSDVGTRIRTQQARRDAVLLVVTAMETGLLPYPKSGKPVDKWDRMLDLIHETTNDLLEQEGVWTTRSQS